MLDRKWLIANLDSARQGLARRGAAVVAGLDALADLDLRRRTLVAVVEEKRHARKTASEDIGRRKKAGEDTSTAQADVRALGEEISALDEKLAALEVEIEARLREIPNMPLDEVPDGAADTDNVVVRTHGEPVSPDWAKPHWDIGEALGILDLERAARISGARFAFVRGLAARLETELAAWMMSVHAAAGYEPILPPYLVRSEALIGTGQLPKFADDLFHVEKQDLWLIPTAEVPVTNYFAGEILEAADVPQRFVAFSPCFRAEAGAAGRDTRGIIRVHQFHKVELVRFERPEASRAALEEMLGHAERILQMLELPYRVVRLCAGDLGFSSAMTYDIEVWLPGQRRWLEISSCSTFGDFQARRAGLRFRPEAGGKPEFMHTLNGSGLAVGRTLVAILENGQQPDGSVRLPAVLKDRLGSDTIISLKT